MTRDTRHLFLLGICLATALAWTPACAAAAGRIVQTVDGDDWSLPAYARLTPWAGWVSWSNASWAQKRAQLPHFQDGAIHLGVCVSRTWNEINPSEGVFDFKPLDSAIASVTAKPGIGFTLWIKAYNKMDKEDNPTQPEIPPWVVQKGKVKFLSNGTPAAWEPGCEFQKYYGQLVRALGERYARHPKLIAMDMRGLDCEWGEWCWRGGLPLLQEAESKTSLNPDTFRAWGMRFHDDYLEAFKGAEKKLVVMNAGGMIWASGMKNDYSKAAREIWQHAYDKGCGGRDGMVEVWNGYIADGYGMVLTDQGYLEVKEDFPPIRNGAVWYTENECYLGHGDDGFGGRQHDGLRWFVSNMRTLQMRRNWIWPNIKAVDELLPEFNRWVEFSLGKTAETSPDAWSWLREGYLPNWEKNRPVKNFERWLFQRDVKPDGITVPEEKVDISKLGQEESGLGHEFHARRTNVSKGSRYIYFRAERRFLGPSLNRMELKVTYLDGPATKWCVEYVGSSGNMRSAEVETSGSGKWKTVTLELPGLRPSGAFADGNDFRIAAMGTADVTIKLVRLVKPDPPSAPQRVSTTTSTTPEPTKPAVPQAPAIDPVPHRAALQELLQSADAKKDVKTSMKVWGRDEDVTFKQADKNGLKLVTRGTDLPVRWKDVGDEDLARLASLCLESNAAALFHAGALAASGGITNLRQKIGERLAGVSPEKAKELDALIGKAP